MTLPEIDKKIQLIKLKIGTINTELMNLDYAINNVENPEDSYTLVGLFDQKVEEFKKLQEEFTQVLNEYNELSKKDNNVISFTAKKLLKAIN